MRFIIVLIFVGLCSCKREPDTKSWYTVTSEMLCSEGGQSLDMKKFAKYKTWHPYDTVKSIREDSISISFDFIAQCCLNFEGSVDVKRDTLKLLYSFGNDSSACNCFCDYRMKYKIRNNNLKWSAVKIVNTDGYAPY